MQSEKLGHDRWKEGSRKGRINTRRYRKVDEQGKGGVKMAVARCGCWRRDEKLKERQNKYWGVKKTKKERRRRKNKWWEMTDRRRGRQIKKSEEGGREAKLWGEVKRWRGG